MAPNTIEQDNLVVEPQSIKSISYLDAPIYNTKVFWPTLHVKLDLEVFKNYKLDYIYEKHSKSILGTDKIFDTSKIVGETPEYIINMLPSLKLERDNEEEIPEEVIDDETSAILNTINTILGIDESDIPETTEDEPFDTVEIESCNGKVLELPKFDDSDNVQSDLIIDDGCSLTITQKPNPIISLPVFDIELDKPWIDIDTDLLRKDSGLHVYVIRFENIITHDTLLQQFAYIIQDDTPDKPYIYMNRD